MPAHWTLFNLKTVLTRSPQRDKLQGRQLDGYAMVFKVDPTSRSLQRFVFFTQILASMESYYRKLAVMYSFPFLCKYFYIPHCILGAETKSQSS